MSAGVRRRALVVGATSWGCTLALQFNRAGADAGVLCRSAEEATRLAAEREHRRLLPGIALPEALHFVADPADFDQPDLIVFAVPAQRLRRSLRDTLPRLPQPAPLLSAAKGLERSTQRRMSEVIAEEAAAAGFRAPVAVLSGPNIAREIALDQLSTTVVAAADLPLAATVQGMLMTPRFRVYTNPDPIGVELGGALKNIIAIAVGIAEAHDVGANGRAALLTRGLAEMARLGAALGADPRTFSGLSGLGDLIATAFSPRSRNRSLGEQLGRGRSLEDVLAGMVHVVEGVETAAAAQALGRRLRLDLPITEQVYQVLFERRPPADAIDALMTRAAGDELARTDGA